MAVTAYMRLLDAGLGSIGPPAFFGLRVFYQLVDTVTNTALATANGDFEGAVAVQVNAPVTSHASILPACTAAVQAAEPGHPGLAFIWLGL